MPFLTGFFGIFVTAFNAVISSLSANALVVALWAAKRITFNMLILTSLVSAIGLLTVSYISTITTEYVNALNSVPVFNMASYFLPDNFLTCVTIFFSVKISGTIYVFTVRFLENKSTILKA